MQSFIHTLRWPAMLLIAMSGLIVSVADLQAQTIPAKLAGTDRVPAELQVSQADAGRRPTGPPSQAQLVQVLQQRGVSVDAQTLVANAGKRKLRGSSRVPSELGQPNDRGDSGVRLQRPTQAALLQRMRQTPGGRARLDEARRRGAPLETSTGQAPSGGRNSNSSATDNLLLASIAGPTWAPAPGEGFSATGHGNWSAYFSKTRVLDNGSKLFFRRVYIAGGTLYKLRNNGCVDMLLKIPADGWYIVWYHMNIAPGTKLVVTNYATKLAEFSGDGTWKSYPTLLEMEDGYVYITACTPDIAQNVSYFMSGAYDIP